MPQPSQLSPAEVRGALARILRSKEFARAERLCRFLTYVIELKLAGRDSEIKETMIALEVFGRGSSYDSAIDSVVRVEARRLRAKLGAFYKNEGKSEVLRIEIPRGTYVPVFLGGEEIQARRRRRRLRTLGLAAGIILAAGLLLAAYRANQQSRINVLLEQADRLSSGAVDYSLQTSAQRNVPGSLASLMNAAGLFEQALQLDPRNARAHVGLARTYWLAGDYNPEMYIQSKAAADRALGLGLERSDFHFYRGYAAFFVDNDFESARAEFLRAIQLNERCDSCYRYFADASWITGQLSDCDPVLRRGLKIFPESDALVVVWHSFLVRTGQFEEALNQARHFAGRRPNLHAAHRVLGLSLALLGRKAEAVSAYKDCLRFSVDDLPCLSRLARTHAEMGDTARAEALRDRLIQLKASPVFLALVSMDLRRHDDALSYLEKALDGRDAGLYYLRVEPVWRPLDGNPRFEAIVNRSLARKRP